MVGYMKKGTDCSICLPALINVCGLFLGVFLYGFLTAKTVKANLAAAADVDVFECKGVLMRNLFNYIQIMGIITSKITIPWPSDFKKSMSSTAQVQNQTSSTTYSFDCWLASSLWNSRFDTFSIFYVYSIGTILTPVLGLGLIFLFWKLHQKINNNKIGNWDQELVKWHKAYEKRKAKKLKNLENAQKSVKNRTKKDGTVEKSTIFTTIKHMILNEQDIDLKEEEEPEMPEKITDSEATNSI